MRTHKANRKRNLQEDLPLIDRLLAVAIGTLTAISLFLLVPVIAAILAAL